MNKLLTLPNSADLLGQVHGFQDDFHGFLTASSDPYWTVVTAVDGTVTVNDEVGGVVTIANGVASIGDNEDCYLVREPEGFLFANNKPLQFEARLKFTEVSTNTCNVFAGLTDAAAANLLVNDGAGPKTSGTTLGFFKKDGNLNWHVHCSLSTTQTSTELTAANSLTKAACVAGSTSYQKLRCEFIPTSTTKADLCYWIDDVLVYKITDYVYTSATEIQAVIGCKGGTAAAMSVLCDYVSCYQVR